MCVLGWISRAHEKDGTEIQTSGRHGSAGNIEKLGFLILVIPKHAWKSWNLAWSHDMARTCCGIFRVHFERRRTRIITTKKGILKNSCHFNISNGCIIHIMCISVNHSRDAMCLCFNGYRRCRADSCLTEREVCERSPVRGSPTGSPRSARAVQRMICAYLQRKWFGMQIKARLRR